MIKIPVRISSDLSPLLAIEMTKSVRAHIPDVELIHVTEPGSPKLDCFDSVLYVASNRDYVEQLIRTMTLIDGNVISLDYDILLREDVSDVFDQEFDVAFTKRPDQDKTIVKQMQESYNMGVIFSKSTEFWEKLLAIYMMQPLRDGWLGSQNLASQIAVHLSSKYKLIELPGDEYNHPPQSRDEDLTGRKIVHYKGARKEWMLSEELAGEATASIRKTLSLIK
jgi:hypothetical protein